MVLKRFKFSVFFICLLQSLSFADNNLTFDYDYAIFRDDSQKVFLELYYSFTPNELIFIKTSSGFTATGRLVLDVLNKSTDKTIAVKDFRIPVTLSDTSGSFKNFQLTGQINILLDSGTYLLKMAASDLNDSTKSNRAEEEVVLRSFSNGPAALSTIELSTGIVKSSDENNIFYKNTLEVTPNPANLFGNNLSKLYYYLELYNLSKAELGDNYTVTVSVANQDGTEIFSVPKKYDVKSESKVEYGNIDIAGLPSNKYILYVKLFDGSNREMLRAFKYFFIYNSDSLTGSVNLTDIENEFLLSEYPKLTEMQVDDEFNKAIYILSDQQKGKYESLKSVDQKRMFMFKYWKGIAAYIKKKDYFSRIDYGNKNFKNDFRDGWKTDMGRIYAIYGRYDDIQRYPYEGATRAYEIWTYNNVQGGIIFVFMDNSSGFGDYILIHSTALNETRDDDWQERINIR